MEFLYSVSGVADVGIKKSFLRKLWDGIIGVDTKEGFLVKPLGVAVDLRGRLYVTDTGARCVHVFDREKKKYRRITRTRGGWLRSPIAVAIGGDGKVYVTDSVLKEVVVYGPRGDVKFSIKGYFQRPTGIVILDDRLYVVDTVGNKIRVFDLDGTFLFAFGRRGTQSGEFNFPVFAAASQYLYVTDAMNFRVQVLDDSGRVVYVFGEAGDVQGTFASPKGVAVDSEGHIYVADALFDSFQIFDGTGMLLLVVGGFGHRDGEFWMPSGIYIDKEDRIYVVDALNRRVQVFQYLGNGE
ncbi:MAG: 6-bladed beta-propeller [Fidelibacterota bacterium]